MLYEITSIRVGLDDYEGRYTRNGATLGYTSAATRDLARLLAMEKLMEVIRQDADHLRKTGNLGEKAG